MPRPPRDEFDEPENYCGDPWCDGHTFSGQTCPDPSFDVEALPTEPPC